MNRTVVRCLRFRPNQTRPREWRTLTIQATELREAFLRCVRYTQGMDFRDGIKAPSEGRALSRRSQLSRLNPFLDENGTLRVESHLQESQLSFAERQPAILTGQCHLARLIIDWAHRASLHGGFAMTYSYVLKRAWILRGRQRTKALIRECVDCTRAREKRWSN